MWQIILYPTNILLPFYVNTESKNPYILTSSTHLTASFSYSSSGSIVTPTPTVTQGKWALWIKLISCSQCYF